jgi:hypothetical protein
VVFPIPIPSTQPHLIPSLNNPSPKPINTPNLFGPGQRSPSRFNVVQAPPSPVAPTIENISGITPIDTQPQKLVKQKIATALLTVRYDYFDAIRKMHPSKDALTTLVALTYNMFYNGIKYDETTNSCLQVIIDNSDLSGLEP